MAEILLPVGRMVGGSLIKMFQATDNKGALKIKAGTTEPMMRLNFACAIPKGSETHWNQTPWGQAIVAVAAAGFPNGEYNAPTFAWKITDGDSQVPNKKGNRPCDQEGYTGNWVIWFSQSWMPKKVSADGMRTLAEDETIVPGYYVQVLLDCKDNAPCESPGVYMNPAAVALSGYGEVFVGQSDVDTTNVGFGGALPPGASTTPVGQMTPPPVPGATQHDFINPPPAPGVAPPAPPAPPVVVEPTMTPLAGGQLYQTFIDAGWTNETLLANGYITLPY